MSASGRPIPAPPDKPSDAECCHRGCTPCIFDYYWDAIERWERRVRIAGADPDEELARLGRTR
jgi:hypothetical protein